MALIPYNATAQVLLTGILVLFVPQLFPQWKNAAWVVSEAKHSMVLANGGSLPRRRRAGHSCRPLKSPKGTEHPADGLALGIIDKPTPGNPRNRGERKGRPRQPPPKRNG